MLLARLAPRLAAARVATPRRWAAASPGGGPADAADALAAPLRERAEAELEALADGGIDDAADRKAKAAKKRADGGQTTDDASPVEELGGPRGPEPTRFGDWERAGRCSDF